MPEEITLQLRHLWRLDTSFGQVLNLDGIHARVYYEKQRAGRSSLDMICAGIQSMHGPSVTESGFGSVLEGQEWCERWVLYMSGNARLKKEVEHYQSCYRSVSNELSKLRGELNEARWDDVRAKYGWNAPKEEEG